jgi:hypothetical protein
MILNGVYVVLRKNNMKILECNMKMLECKSVIRESNMVLQLRDIVF